MNPQPASETATWSNIGPVKHGYPPPRLSVGEVTTAYCGAELIVEGECSDRPPQDACAMCALAWENSKRPGRRWARAFGIGRGSPAFPISRMTPAADPSSDARWKARFHAARMSLPEWAVLRPDHCVFVSNASGTFEIYTWDRTTGVTEQVTATSQRNHLGRDRSTWRVDLVVRRPRRRRVRCLAQAPVRSHPQQRRTTSPPDAVPGLPPSYPSGLCLGPDGLAIIGRSTDDGAAIYATTPDQEARLLYSHAQHASVSALSRDGTLFAIEHSEHGDTRHPALRVLRVADGAAVADLFDGPGRGLEAVAFAPVAGDSRIICRHERLGRWMPFIWDVVSGAEQPLALDLPGDVSAHWFPDASALLVLHEYEARSSLYRYDLATGSLHPIEIPAGTVAGATARPDGVVEFMWSSGAEPPAVRDSQGRVVIRAPGQVAPESVPVIDAWVDGPGGRIHALVSKPPDARRS